MHEKSMVWSGTDDPHGLSVLRIPTDPAIDHEQVVFHTQVILSSLEDSVVSFSWEHLVDVTPPDLLVLAGSVWLDNPLVLGRPTTLLA